ncbi:MAG TPA: hypothetical protein VER03_10905 [Bryobacteraceae bacterium]|nr:hypothetical protein [Bryobacteraceae bacterium]
MALVIGHEARAIVWAQWRSMANHYGRTRHRGIPITAIFGLLWYGMWAFVAVAVCRVVADPQDVALLKRAAPATLLLQFGYWQIVPIVMVSTGVSLDLSRLIVYPIPHVQLFTIEVLLRVTTSIEMLLISAGIVAGILLNPTLPTTGALAILVFAIFNLFVAAAVKDLLGRLLARKRVREGLVFLLVLMAALPQVLLVSGAAGVTIGWQGYLLDWWTPWGATAALSFDAGTWGSAAMQLTSTAPAWLIGSNQFERTILFDSAEAGSRGRSEGRRLQVLDAPLRVMSAIFKDPLAALVEKEVRFLSRSARFRLLFLMGFSFGLLIWLPMAIRGDGKSFIQTNYLTVVTGYALMLLGEICFWNTFGLDRGAAQAYFTMPVSMSTVLRSKNVAALFFILLEFLTVSALCALLRMPVTASTFAEALCVTIVFSVFLMSFGNLLSVRHPRPVDPAQSWRHGASGRAQAYLLLLYPAAAGPVALAFGARFAFDSEAAFYGVLLLDLLIGLVLYSIALESSAKTAEHNREGIVQALSRAEGPAAG